MLLSIIICIKIKKSHNIVMSPSTPNVLYLHKVKIPISAKCRVSVYVVYIFIILRRDLQYLTLEHKPRLKYKANTKSILTPSARCHATDVAVVQKKFKTLPAHQTRQNGARLTTKKSDWNPIQKSIKFLSIDGSTVANLSVAYLQISMIYFT